MINTIVRVVNLRVKPFLLYVLVLYIFHPGNLFCQPTAKSFDFDRIYGKGIETVFSNPGVSKHCLKELELRKKELSPVQQAKTSFLRLRLINADTAERRKLDRRMFEAPDSLRHTDALIYSARKFLEKSMPDKAIHLLMEALDTLKTGSEKADFCKISLCEAYRQKQEYSKGIEMLNEILNNQNSVSDVNRAYAYNRLAAIYDEWGVKKYNNADSVEKYSLLCISLSEKINSKSNLAFSQNELSYRFILAKKYDKALELSQKAIKNFDDAGMIYSEMNALINQSNIFIGLKDYKLALQSVVDATNLCAIEENRNLFMRLYLQFATIYSLTGNYKDAYSFMALSRSLLEDFYGDRISTQINEQSARYDLFTKEQKLREEKQENEFRRKQLTFLVIILIILFIAFVLSIFYFRLKRKDFIKQKLIEAVIQTEEKERKRIASDLHDGLGPSLSAAKLYFQAYIDAEDAEGKAAIESKFLKIIDGAIDDTSRISHNISPHILETYGLKIALENFISEMNISRNIKLGLSCEKISRFDLKVELTIYRTVLELINNTIKHAKGSHIAINICVSEGMLHVQYEDDGTGFPAHDKTNVTQGMGLINIKSRIYSLKGSVIFSNHQSGGMRASIKVPYKQISDHEEA